MCQARCENRCYILLDKGINPPYRCSHPASDFTHEQLRETQSGDLSTLQPGAPEQAQCPVALLAISPHCFSSSVFALSSGIYSDGLSGVASKENQLSGISKKQGRGEKDVRHHPTLTWELEEPLLRPPDAQVRPEPAGSPG